MKTVNPNDRKASDFYTQGAYWRTRCKPCDNERRYAANKRRREQRALEGTIRGFTKPKKRGRRAKFTDSVTIKYCPLEHWPTHRYFNRSEFFNMLQDGYCTPGMYVEYQGDAYFVLGKMGLPQWMVALTP